MEFKVSQQVSLPETAVTQTYAFIGRKGSGKTYAAGKLTEKFLAADVQCVVLDPGEWLRPKLGGAENDILDVLIEARGERLPKEQLAKLAGKSANSGSFNNALSRLRSLEAAEGYERDGGTKAADVFFE